MGFSPKPVWRSRRSLIDLMARPSNVQTDLSGKPLPFFSESPLVNALGVNVFAQSPVFYGPEVFSNPYVFPPICLIPQIFKYLNSLKLPYTLVVPRRNPTSFLVVFAFVCMLFQLLVSFQRDKWHSSHPLVGQPGPRSV